MLNSPPKSDLIKNFTVKNSTIVMITNTGKYFNPSFSFPFAINPKISEPMNDVNIKDVRVYVFTNFGVMLTLLNVNGKFVPVLDVGSSTFEKISVITSTKNELRPNNIGAPKPIAEKMKITYTSTLERTRCSTNFC